MISDRRKPVDRIARSSGRSMSAVLGSAVVVARACQPPICRAPTSPPCPRSCQTHTRAELVKGQEAHRGAAVGREGPAISWPLTRCELAGCLCGEAVVQRPWCRAAQVAAASRRSGRRPKAPHARRERPWSAPACDAAAADALEYLKGNSE